MVTTFPTRSGWRCRWIFWSGIPILICLEEEFWFLVMAAECLGLTRIRVHMRISAEGLGQDFTWRIPLGWGEANGFIKMAIVRKRCAARIRTFCCALMRKAVSPRYVKSSLDTEKKSYRLGKT